MMEGETMSGSDVNRRDFLKIAGAATAALGVPNTGRAAVASKMIGIQVGAISFVDEGTEKVLDILQERGSVNTLFLAVFTYGRGIAGRQIPGQPLPDHGKQEYDLNFHGGNFATPHPQYYKNTVLKDTRAPDHGNLDILAEVIPAAKKRGMKVICWLEDVFRSDLPNIERLCAFLRDRRAHVGIGKAGRAFGQPGGHPRHSAHRPGTGDLLLRILSAQGSSPRH
jgi:hypothetical protein